MNTKTIEYFLISALLTIITEPVLGRQSTDVNNKDSILRIKKANDFTVTGNGSATVWNSIPWVDLPQRKTNKPLYKSAFKILYSDSGIYCLFKCEDRKITATLKEDFLDLYNEDVVEVFFWTDESSPIYFEYEISPLNYELVILVPNYSGNFLGWRPWHYEGNRKTRHATNITRKTDGSIDSWTAEFFIPYLLLKPLQNVPPRKGTRWRGNFYRIDYDQAVSQWSWQLTRKNFHDYERFGTLLFD